MTDVPDGSPTAVVTGGGSGIGAACAARLAEAGNMIVLVGRRPEPLADVAERIGDAGGVARAFPADIRDWDRLGELREAIDGWSGRVDVLVNAAGGQFHAPAERLTPNALRAVVDTNLTGTFFACRQLYPLLARCGGAIVNVVASVWQRPSGPAARVPLRRVASAAEVADAALFLARSTYTTGEVLTVDGGFQLM